MQSSKAIYWQTDTVETYVERIHLKYLEHEQRFNKFIMKVIDVILLTDRHKQALSDYF